MVYRFESGSKLIATLFLTAVADVTALVADATPAEVLAADTV
jgi:hypothetical protein